MPYFTMISNLRPITFVEAADYAGAVANANLLALDDERVRVIDRAIPEVATIEEARQAFNAELADEEFQDNFREGFADDADAMRDYENRANDGCCGSADLRYLVAGRFYMIGCNYGH